MWGSVSSCSVLAERSRFRLSSCCSCSTPAAHAPQQAPLTGRQLQAIASEQMRAAKQQSPNTSHAACRPRIHRHPTIYACSQRNLMWGSVSSCSVLAERSRFRLSSCCSCSTPAAHAPQQAPLTGRQLQAIGCEQMQAAKQHCPNTSHAACRPRIHRHPTIYACSQRNLMWGSVSSCSVLAEIRLSSCCSCSTPSQKNPQPGPRNRSSAAGHRL